MFCQPLNTNNDVKKTQQNPRNLCFEFWFVDVRHFLSFVGKVTTVTLSRKYPSEHF